MYGRSSIGSDSCLHRRGGDHHPTQGRRLPANHPQQPPQYDQFGTVAYCSGAVVILFSTWGTVDVVYGNRLIIDLSQVHLFDDSQSGAEIDAKFDVDVKRERLIIKLNQSMERGSIYRLKVRG